jgi:hypothetical protein
MAKKKRNQKNKSMGRIYHKETEVDGIKFDSQTESEYYQYLKSRDDIESFEMQQEFVLQNKFLLVNGKRIDESDKDFKKLQRANPGCTIRDIRYIADFVVYYKDGTVQVVDVKGQKTADFKIKEKMFNYMYPEYNGLYCVAKHKGEWLDYNTVQKLKKKK